MNFDYNTAFSRTLGWITQKERETLKKCKIAIGGLGGVGGIYLLTMVRLGVEQFHIADPDRFELVNFNRQIGATLDSLNKSKTAVLTNMAKSINPHVKCLAQPGAIDSTTVDAFLDGVDLYLDGLDFWAFEARELVFQQCAKRSIPAITVAPLGMGAALVNFTPGKMTFEEYFGLQGQTVKEKAIRFLVGLAPRFLHVPYLVDRNRVDLDKGIGPSTPMACELCAGIACTEALKILLKRQKVLCAPHAVHFDAYRNKLVQTYRPWGCRNPLQILARKLLGRIVEK